MLNRRSLLGLGAFGVPATLLARRLPNQRRVSGTPPATDFSAVLPIPPVLQPVSSDATGDYYELTINRGQAQLRGGPTTEVWGFNGTWPGPTIIATRSRPVHVRVANQLDVDKNVHNHGHKVPWDSDGHPLDPIAPGQTRTYTYPNDQQASTFWYHDHVAPGSAEGIYRGLAGFYLIKDPAEDALNLPSGDYDIPIMLQDRSLDSNNRLIYDLNETTEQDGVFGDTLYVNGVATPHLEVANRKYRLRFLNAANRRGFQLRLGDGDPMTEIGTDGALLATPATRAVQGVFVGNRRDIVIDFSRYPVGSSVVLHNSLSGEATGAGKRFVYADALADVMRFDIVRDEPDPSDVPAELVPIELLRAEDAVQTRHWVIDLTNGVWTINGQMYDPYRIDAFPVLGTTEIWEFENRSDVPHDAHLHMVQYQILSEPPSPGAPAFAGGGANALTWNDTVRVEAHTTAQFIVPFNGFAGVYPFHCHMLEHAEHCLMAQYQTVATAGDTTVDTTITRRLAESNGAAGSQFVCPLPAPQ
jgi:spore coat protein A, manganese oxidase